MKWLPLKMNFLPLIFQEINFVTEEYISLLNKLRQREKDKPKEENKFKNNITNSSKKSNPEQSESESEHIKEKDPESEKGKEMSDDEVQLLIKKYNSLRESISKRINELEDFYEDNLEDVRVSNFEKARLRLKKLLMYSYENINKIENSSQQKNIFIKESNNLFNKKMTEDTKKKIIENNISLEKQLIKERNKEEEKAKKKLIGNEVKQKKNINQNKKEGNNNKRRVIRVRGDEGFLKPIDRGRKSTSMKDSENFDGLDYDDVSKCREIIFKIKLNQDEYKLLLKEKKNKGPISPYLFK